MNLRAMQLNQGFLMCVVVVSMCDEPSSGCHATSNSLWLTYGSKSPTSVSEVFRKKRGISHVCDANGVTDSICFCFHLRASPR